jgi:hypothetical protein
MKFFQCVDRRIFAVKFDEEVAKRGLKLEHCGSTGGNGPPCAAYLVRQTPSRRAFQRAEAARKVSIRSNPACLSAERTAGP